ncbi:MAG: imidazole glycerol phosphate synthase subunit HisH [Gammaproteobacteria bacterium]|nr:imidazole glycerol phosphate synthase subunit HisH [Gammaproteobacteria bacterium]
MPTCIAVVDFGMGNLRSVAKALERVAPEARVRVTSEAAAVRAADRVVFPGQGAIGDCMVELARLELREVVLEAARARPFLGICLGLQALMEWSEENGGTEALGVLPGNVRRFGELHDPATGEPLKVPHMGWNRVRPTMAHPLWEGIDERSWFYFVHSYYVEPASPGPIAGITQYGFAFASVLARDNVFAAQFHPEKSQHDGLRLLENFVRWSPE